ncbi:hypothetical protein [Natrialba chahannaoensis]|uniref:hypothetical protein n=1 Tax=Natrialba chahannaoensis TaxID=68911 RepID=UPI001267A9FB|nr:hypothetical protein [Natrialba chahannaoensis]
MSEDTQPTRRNVLKKGTAATAVALGGVATIGGSASASESDATPSSADGSLSITGYGSFTVEFEGSGIDVISDGRTLTLDETTASGLSKDVSMAIQTVTRMSMCSSDLTSLTKWSQVNQIRT